MKTNMWTGRITSTGVDCGTSMLLVKARAEVKVNTNLETCGKQKKCKSVITEATWMGVLRADKH